MAKLCNAGANMSLGKWWWWAVLGLLALYCLMLFNKWRAIEGDIQSRSQAVLNNAGHNWASVDQTDHGRDVTLMGNAPGQTSLDNALALVADVEGVRVVDHDVSLVNLVSSKIELNTRGDRAILMGALPDQSSIDRVVAGVEGFADASQIDNQIKVSDTASVPDWLDNLIGALPVLNKLRNADVAVSDAGLLISGEVENEADQRAIDASFTDKFGRGYTGNLKVVPAGPSAAELARLEAERLAALEAERLASQEMEEIKLAEAQQIPDEEESKLAEHNAFMAACQIKINQVMASGKVEFSSASASISQNSFALLDNVVELLDECDADGRLQIEIAGHTDSTGDDAYNQYLSETRAQAVVKHLQNAGTGDGVLTAKGYGESQPIADNATAEGRAKNRRIQFNIQQ